jgi:hypothetical protein
MARALGSVRFVVPVAVLMLWAGTVLAQPKSASGRFRINEASRITASDPGQGDGFGRGVAISGDVAVVGAPSEDQGGTDSGSVYVYRFTGSGWAEEAKLGASDPTAGGYFGCSVAIDGDIVLVAKDRDHNAPICSGAAYVFRFDGARWFEESKLVPADRSSCDNFGSSVSVSGELALVGAARGQGCSLSGKGSAYVFRFNGERWIEETKLAASDAASNEDLFGFSVSASGDRCVVGASNAWSRAQTAGGAAYVYHYDGAHWVEEAKLTAFDALWGDRFGSTVSIDEDVVLVGAPGKDDAVADSGAAYVFRYRGGWLNEGKLVPSDIASGDQFASSVSVNGDSALMGSLGDDDRGDSSGSAYLYRFSDGKWTEGIKFTASDGAASDVLGLSVCLGATLAIVGACGDDTDAQDTGSAYVFGTVIANSDPPCRAIDARQPCKPDGTGSAGWNAVRITFDDNPGILVPSDFTVTVIPPEDFPLLRVYAVVQQESTATLWLNGLVPLRSWVTITHQRSGVCTRIGYLPADVNGDGVSAPADILTIIDNLNGCVAPPLGVWQCDVDRSGRCAPADILRVIDLLNGADAYDAYLGATLPK